jgi:hypothetical protein
MDMRALRGSFLFRALLTQTVRWGSAELPSGEYAYSIEERATVPLIFIHGTARGSKSGIIVSPNWDATVDSHASEIQLVSDGKEMVVQSFYVAALDRVFHYSTGVKTLHAEKKKQPLQTAVARPANAR